MNPLLLEGGISLLGSVLGGGAARAAKKQAAEMQARQQAAIAQTAALRPQYMQYAEDANADYNAWRPQSNEAIQNYARVLGTDKYTDDYSAARIGKATGGATNAYLAARARIAASMADRGLSDSNIAEGARVGNENDYARTMSQAHLNLGLEQVDDRERRQQALVNLLTGATQNSRQNAFGAMGEADNNSRYQAGAYGQLAGQAQAQAAAQQAGIASMVGGIGRIAGGIAGGGPQGIGQQAVPVTVDGTVPQLPPGYIMTPTGPVKLPGLGSL